MTKYSYRNIMEILVEQEVTRQLAKVPLQLRQHMRSVEIVTYALNRLPTLYACSERGMQLQLKNAKKEHGPQIVQAVQWAIAAVQRDPLRQFKPFQQQDQQTLDELRLLLGDKTLTWQTLPQVVQQVLREITRDELNTKAPSPNYSPHSGAVPKQDTRQKSQRKPSFSQDDFGWDNDAFIR